MSSSTLSTSTLAIVAHAAGDLRIEQIDLAAPGADEARVAIAYGGICGSDLHYWSHGAAGESILKAPMVLGHEIVGTVIQAAADGSGPAVGAKVAVHPATPGETGEPYPGGLPEPFTGLHLSGLGRPLPAHRGRFCPRSEPAITYAA